VRSSPTIRMLQTSDFSEGFSPAKAGFRGRQNQSVCLFGSHQSMEIGTSARGSAHLLDAFGLLVSRLTQGDPEA
jgi:hypothetical protein